MSATGLLVMADETPVPQILATMRSKDFRTAYANSIRVRIGNNDCSIVFAYQTQLADNRLVLMEEAEIIVSALSLKVLQKTLDKVIGDIETALGNEIPVPQEILDIISGMQKIPPIK
jgi:Protein of unknown function (DUF3467)